MAGRVADSSVGIQLPDGSTLSPDACFVTTERFEAIPKADLRRFPNVVPDFIIEVMLPSDRLRESQAKMEDRVANGVPLAGLIDADTKTVDVYQPSAKWQALVNAASLEGAGPVEGFVLDLQRIWSLA